MNKHLKNIILAITVLLAINFLQADISVPSIFGSQMVFQRDQENPVWGWADPGESVRIRINNQTIRTKADKQGNWKVNLKALPVGGPYTLEIAGKNKLVFEDVLCGEVWLCSGQSNMQWSISQVMDGDLEILSANNPNIRLITVPQVGTQEPQRDFEGTWEKCTPESVKSFSAVGYMFGRQLHQTLGIPVGLIDNAWGGSACEAWIRKDLLQKDPMYAGLMEKWTQTAASYDHEAAVAKYEEKLEKWTQGGKKGARPRPPRNPLVGQHRPANLYNGVLKPITGYGIKGAIWYQGESNSSRAYQYRELFPLMIQSWRNEWDQGDFPFYFVQLADFRPEQDQPGESTWAELREAQTLTLSKLSNTGQAVIIDLGEGRDIHPRKKQRVATRLARWALAKDYGYDVMYQGPTYSSHSVEGNKIVVKFDMMGGQLYTFDKDEVVGFAIAGDDRNFVWAKAKIVGKDTVEVWSDEIVNPVSVRYAWADNPVCNLTNKKDLPVTPFRTDDWPGLTVDADR